MRVLGKNVNERTQGGCLRFSTEHSESLGIALSTAPSSVEFIITAASSSISWTILNSGIKRSYTFYDIIQAKPQNVRSDV